MIELNEEKVADFESRMNTVLDKIEKIVMGLVFVAFVVFTIFKFIAKK